MLCFVCLRVDNIMVSNLDSSNIYERIVLTCKRIMWPESCYESYRLASGEIGIVAMPLLVCMYVETL